MEDDYLDPRSLNVVDQVRTTEPSTLDLLPPRKTARYAKTSDVARAKRLDKARAQRLTRRRTFEEHIKDVERELKTQLTQRSEMHPLSQFARLVNAGLGKGSKVLDITLMLDTTQAKEAIGNVLADLRSAYELREQIEIEQEEALAIGKAEFLASLSSLREDLDLEAARVRTYTTVRDSSSYAQLMEILKPELRTVITRRRWNVLENATLFQDRLLTIKRAAHGEDYDVILGNLFFEQQEMAGIELPTPRGRDPHDIIAGERDSPDVRNVVGITLHAMSLLTPLMTSRNYESLGTQSPVLNMNLLMSAIVLPAIEATSPIRIPQSASQDNLLRGRIKNVLVEMWMEANGRREDYARQLVDRIVDYVDPEESEYASTVEAGHTGDDPAHALLVDLARFFGSEVVYDLYFWPSVLLKILVKSGAQQSGQASVFLGKMCTAILRGVRGNFGVLEILDMAELPGDDHELTRDVYNLKGFTALLGVSSQWLDWHKKARKTSAAERLERQLHQKMVEWGPQLKALDLRDAFSGEGSKFLDDVNILSRDDLATVIDGLAAPETRRRETFTAQIAKIRREIVSQVADVFGIKQPTLDELLQTQLQQLASNSEIPSKLRSIIQENMRSRGGAGIGEEDGDSSIDELLDSFKLDREQTPYEQPMIFNYCYDLQRAFDAELRQAETDVNSLSRREDELRADGEAQGWLRPDGAEIDTASSLQKQEDVLRNLTEVKISESTEGLRRSIEQRHAFLESSAGIRLRGDMEGAAHDVFTAIAARNRGWAQSARDVTRLMTSRDRSILSSLAGAVAATINMAEIRSGTRGNYVQNQVYVMNQSQKASYMERLEKASVWSA